MSSAWACVPVRGAACPAACDLQSVRVRWGAGVSTGGVYSRRPAPPGQSRHHRKNKKDPPRLHKPKPIQLCKSPKIPKNTKKPPFGVLDVVYLNEGKGHCKMAKLIKCKHCGARIAVTAKTCPQCGGENTPPKPVYQRFWFKVIAVMFVLAFIMDLVSPRDKTDTAASSESEKSPSSVASSVKAESENPFVTSEETIKRDGSFVLVDEVLGDYGKEETNKSGYKYIWYMVPAGTYQVENRNKEATVFVVSDANSDDVSNVLKFEKAGERQNVTVKDGYHIELSISTEILLTPVK